MLHSLMGGLLDLLAPPTCPGCNLPWHASGGESLFCDACAPLIELPPSDRRPPQRLAAVARYQGPIADAIRRFKYASATDLAPALGLLLAKAAYAYAGVVDAVVPMPLHPEKLRTRGYNPSLLLARPVARALGVPLRVDWLRRTRATRNQAGLSSDTRLQNVRGAFAARSVEPRRVLLIDDVWTTGATLDAAAGAMRAVGHELTTLALAWAPEPTSSGSV